MDTYLQALSSKVALQLTRLQSRVTNIERAQRTDQLTGSSIENGSLYIKDGSGLIRGIIGMQPDGTITTVDQNAPLPEVAPSVPIIAAVAAGLSITWDGNSSDGTADFPADFSYVQIHVSDTTGFTPSAATLVGVLHTSGVYTVAPLAIGTEYYVVLAMMNTSGMVGPPSVEANGVPIGVTIGPGEITETMIADDSISTPKLQAESVTADQMAADSVEANSIVTGAIDATKLAALIALATTIIAGTEGGPGVQLDSTGLFGLDNSGMITFSIDSADGSAIFAGTVQMSAESGEFLAYSGIPTDGNLVASLAITGGTDAYGNTYDPGFVMGSAGGTQVAVVPSAGIAFNGGILNAITQYTTSDSNEVLPAIVGTVLLNAGAANQQMASLFSCPIDSTSGFGIVMSTESDDATVPAQMQIGTTSTDGASITFTPVLTLDATGRRTAVTDLFYNANPVQKIITLSLSGTHTWTSPSDVPATVKAEVFAPAGGAGDDGGGGGQGGEWSCEPAAAITKNHAYTYTNGAHGLGGIAGTRSATPGGNSQIALDAVTVLAHGGINGTFDTAGSGAATSTNTLHHGGGVGGAGVNNGTISAQAGGGGGGQAGSPSGAGQAGHAASGRIPGAPGSSTAGEGAWGGWGGWGDEPHYPDQGASAGSGGGYPGGGGGGGGGQTGAGGWRGGDGGAGFIRITYTPTASLRTSVSGTAGTDAYGNTYPAGHGDLTLASQFNKIAAVSTDTTLLTANATGFESLTRNWPIAASDVKPGTVYKITAWGSGAWGTAGTTSPRLSIRGNFGSVALGAASLAAGAFGSVNVNWTFECWLVFVTNGSSGTWRQWSKLSMSGTSSSTSGAQAIGSGDSTADGTINTTAATNFFVEASWANTTGSPALNAGGSMFERLGPA